MGILCDSMIRHLSGMLWSQSPVPYTYTKSLKKDETGLIGTMDMNMMKTNIIRK